MATLLFKKTYNNLKDGRICSPYCKYIYYHGNILFRSGFTNKLFSLHNPGAIHILGFRFTITIH